jgi:hypothetical protein
VDVIGIRYYFGYESNLKNKIRLIFIAVKPNNRNLILSGNSQAYMIERDWPPL